MRDETEGCTREGERERERDPRHTVRNTRYLAGDAGIDALHVFLVLIRAWILPQQFAKDGQATAAGKRAKVQCTVTNSLRLVLECNLATCKKFASTRGERPGDGRTKDTAPHALNMQVCMPTLPQHARPAAPASRRTGALWIPGT